MFNADSLSERLLLNVSYFSLRSNFLKKSTKGLVFDSRSKMTTAIQGRIKFEIEISVRSNIQIVNSLPPAPTARGSGSTSSERKTKTQS